MSLLGLILVIILVIFLTRRLQGPQPPSSLPSLNVRSCGEEGIRTRGMALTAQGSFGFRGFASNLIKHACAMLGWYVVEQIDIAREQISPSVPTARRMMRFWLVRGVAKVDA